MHTTRAHGMGPLPAMLEDRAGFRAMARVIEQSGLTLTVLEHRTTRIPLRSMHRLYDLAAREVGDDTFGLEVGAHMGPETYGDWGQYISAGLTLAGTLRRAENTLWIHQSGTHFSLGTAPDHAVFRYHAYRHSSRAHRQHSLHVLPAMIALVRPILGPDWLPDWIELDFPASAKEDPVEEMFPVEVRFDRDALGIAIPRAALDRRRDQPAQGTRTVTYADLIALSGATGNTPLMDISGLIGLRLLEGQNDLDGLAHRMCIGTRTLQRRLRTEGTNYREMLDQAKMTRAVSLLRETELTVLEIALSLGYEEPGNFSRAFKKQMGRRPSDLRMPLGQT